jgi:hypothetical protein
MPSTNEMKLHSEQQHPVVTSGPTSYTRRVNSQQQHRDPYSANNNNNNGNNSSAVSRGGQTTSAQRTIQRDPREGQYAFGKRIQRARASTLKGPGHSIAVKQATDADYIAPRTTLNVAAPNRVKSRGTFGAPPKNSGAIRETAVNKDAVKRALELQPANVTECTELRAPLYSSFRVASLSRAGSWGRPPSEAFKPFAGEVTSKHSEVTEFTTEVPSSIKVSAPHKYSAPSRSPSLRRNGSMSLPRGLSASQLDSSARLGRSYASGASGVYEFTDRTGGWLPKGDEDTPGPGAYFIP